MKSLKPSHKEKLRYVLIKGGDASFENLEKIILEFVGVFGYSKANPKLIKKTNGKIIVAIARKELDEVRASVLMSGKNMEVVKVSGMINKLDLKND